MKTQYLFLLLVVDTVLYCGADARGQDPSADTLGVTGGELVGKGVVFIDGEYLEGPYGISRKGLSLYVNDREILRPRRHMETPVLTGETPPSQLSPDALQRLLRSLDATRDIYESHLSRGYGYLFSSEGGHVLLAPYFVAYKLPQVGEVLESSLSREEKLNALQRSNWHLHINIEPFIDKAPFSTGLKSTMSQQAKELLREEEFGTSPPASVDRGFVFLNGRYLEPPYLFERRGLGLFLNGKWFSPPIEWPRRIPSGETDVLIPSTISSESSWFDAAVLDYICEKQAYLFIHYSVEQATNMLAEAISALPLVTEARRDEARSHVLHVTTTEGLKIPCSLVAPGRRPVRDPQSVMQSVQEKLEQFQRTLGDGACHIISENKGRTSIPPGVVKSTLPSLVAALGSDRSQQAKQDEVKRIYQGIPDEVVKELVVNYTRSSQLEARAAELNRGGGQSQR